MKKEAVLYTVIGVLGGSLLTLLIATISVNSNNRSMMGAMGMHYNQSVIDIDESMGMNAKAGSLTGKTGDEFDKAFLAAMIVHHQGAIEMAKLAKTNAKHDEVKKLAGNILIAQSKEIDMMQTWQGDWGYKNVPTSHDMNMMSH